MSVHAVVLIECEIDGIPEAAQAIADLEGVSEVYSVAGEFDLVAIVRVANHDDLASVIPGAISKVDGVARTETLIAFQVYSKHDLERLFSIGFDEEPVVAHSEGRSIATARAVRAHVVRSSGSRGPYLSRSNRRASASSSGSSTRRP